MGSDFSQKFLNEIETALMEMKSLIVDNLSNESLPESDEVLKEEGDIAQSLRDNDLINRLADRDRLRLNQINKALEKIKNGTYGYCIDTEEPIEEARLRANPLALRTVEAQEDFEISRKNQKN